MLEDHTTSTEWCFINVVGKNIRSIRLTKFMFERRYLKNSKGNRRIDFLQYEPSTKANTTKFFLPGAMTGGDYYKNRLGPLQRRGDRIIIPEPKAILSVGDYVNLFMTLFRWLTPEMDLSNHEIIGHSLGSITGAVLAADNSKDHPRTKSFVSVSPVVPGYDLDLPYYKKQFTKMGVGLLFSQETHAKLFAITKGIPYAANALWKQRALKPLLSSINKVDIAENSLDIPSLLLVNEHDVFFTPEMAIPYYEDICTDLTTKILHGTCHAKMLYRARDITKEIIEFDQTK
ncbi:alpha/beta hydrolase [Candidatus Woesearchaeota archaeon]|nr:alpha/beta hydrolase [Candidatus Woesearchaeota archaeon]